MKHVNKTVQHNTRFSTSTYHVMIHLNGRKLIHCDNLGNNRGWAEHDEGEGEERTLLLINCKKKKPH